MKTTKNLGIILLFISGFLFFNSCDNFKNHSTEKQLRIEEFNNHLFLLHKRVGGAISYPGDENYSFTLDEDVEGKRRIQFIYNTETMEYNLKYEDFQSETNLDFNGTFTLNEDENIIVLDDDIFMTFPRYSIDLRKNVTKYVLLKKNVKFNQDSTLTFVRVKTDTYRYPKREMNARWRMFNGRQIGVSKREFKETTKKRLAEHSNGDREINGMYFVLK